MKSREQEEKENQARDKIIEAELAKLASKTGLTTIPIYLIRNKAQEKNEPDEFPV